MHALITGGAGFIGSHLAEKLLSEGTEVTVIDDLSTGSNSNINHLKRDRRFRYVVDSVMDRAVLAELVDDCDIVFHLAAAVGVQLIVHSPVRAMHTNIRGTELVLEAAAKKKKEGSHHFDLGGLREIYPHSLPRGRRPADRPPGLWAVELCLLEGHR